MLPENTGIYGELGSNGTRYIDAGTLEGEASSYLLTGVYAGGNTNDFFSIPPPATALKITVRGDGYSISSPGASVTITKAALYCTPY